MTVLEAKQAVREAEVRLAAVRGSGSADEADRPETGMTPSHCSTKLHASQAEPCYYPRPKLQKADWPPCLSPWLCHPHHVTMEF